MSFMLINQHAYYAIRNDDADYLVGCVYPLRGHQGPYRVTSSFGSERQSEQIAIVETLDEAVPAFLAYYKANPVPWEREKPALYWHHTMYVELRVEQDQQGHWLAYRDDYPLLENGCAPAWFKTCADAKQAADVHELDLFPNAKVTDDGYSWLLNPESDWRSVPYLAEGREWLRENSDVIVWRSDGPAITSSVN
jgi:hypothetical protein